MSHRIALVASTTADDDAQMLALRLRHLIDRGWDAWLFCKGAQWQDSPALRDPAVRERVEIAPRAKEDASPFDGRLRSLAPDVVHFHSGHAAWKGLRDGQLRGSKIAVTFRADGQDLAFPKVDLLWPRVDAVFFPTQAALEMGLARGCPEERAAIVERPVLGPDGAQRREDGNGTLRVLSAGPLVWEQGFEHSVHAIRLLLDQGVPCEYRIIGEGNHVQAVAFACHQLGLRDHVQLIAQDGLGQLPDELGSADVFVDPAVADTVSPNPLGTALAHGVPFVATARGAALRDDAGIEVPRRDPHAIAAALAQFAADPVMREQMGRRGMRVSGAWVLEDHLGELERLYRAMLTEEPR